jgi:TonB family protein
MWILRRIICAVGCLLIAGAICGARQTAAPAVPAAQVSAALDAFSSPEMDALASSIVEKIRADKATSIVVVGGGSADFKVSDLGVSLRDGLNEALAREAAGFRVITSAEMRDVLKRNRVSESMIYCNALADWIAAHSHANAAVIVQFDGVQNGRYMVSVEMFDERKNKTFDKKTKEAIPYAKFQTYVMLANEYAVAAGHEYAAPIDATISESGKNGITGLRCLQCPRPSYPDEGQQARFGGTVYLQTIVRADGTSDDIRVTKPLGHGLDASAVIALLDWRFAPGVDSEGHPVPTRVNIQMTFQLY